MHVDMSCMHWNGAGIFTLQLDLNPYIQTESYGWLTIEISHGRICRTGVLKLHKSITVLHKDLAHYSVAGKEGSDGLLVAIGREVPHVQLCHLQQKFSIRRFMRCAIHLAIVTS